MKDEHYAEWDSSVCITKFISHGFVISSADDKSQHFILQIYVSNCFNEKQLTDWEKKASVNKDWAGTIKYYKDIISKRET